MSSQDNILEDNVAGDQTPDEERTLREQHSQVLDSEVVIPANPHEPPSGASESSTAGAPAPPAAQPEAVPTEPNSDLSTVVHALYGLVQQMNSRMDRLEASSVPSAPAAPSASAPAPEAPATVAVPAAPVQPPEEASHIRYAMYSHKLRKFGGKDANGDISDWVHHAKFMVPMMSTRGQSGDPERMSMVLQALEGQARIVAENVIQDPNRPRETITWETVLDELLLSFGDPDAERSARRELNELKQKLNEDVVSYIARFEALAHRITGLTDKDAVARIESGLREPYKSRVNNVYLQQKVADPDFEFSPLSLKTLLKRAHTMEQQAPALGLKAVSDESDTATGAGPSYRGHQRGRFFARTCVWTAGTVPKRGRGSVAICVSGASGEGTAGEPRHTVDTPTRVGQPVVISKSRDSLDVNISSLGQESWIPVSSSNTIEPEDGNKVSYQKNLGTPQGPRPKGRVSFMPGFLARNEVHRPTLGKLGRLADDPSVGAAPPLLDPQQQGAVVEEINHDLEVSPSQEHRLDHPGHTGALTGSGVDPLEANACQELQAPSASQWKPRNRKDWENIQALVLGQNEPILRLFVAELLQIEQKKTSSGRMAIVNGQLGDHETELRVLFDSGACGNFVSLDVVQSLQLPVDSLASPKAVTVANGQRCQLHYGLAPATTLALSSSTGEWKGKCAGDSTLLVLPHLHGYDIILGTPFFSRWEASLSFKKTNPTVELMCPGDGGNKSVTLTANTSMQPTATCCSHITWEELMVSDEVEEFMLCLLTPEDIEELKLANLESDFNTAKAGTTPPASEAERVELWDDLDEEIEGTTPTPPEPDEFEHLRKELLERNKDILQEKLPRRGPDNPPPQFTHKIPFTEEGKAKPPTAARPRRMNPRDHQELRRVVQQLLQDGLIRPSSSPMGSAVLFAKKKDGSLRFCIDYRAINAVTENDSYPLPNIHELLDRLHGAKFFSSIDLVSGYWQIPVADCDVEKTAFVTSLGAFEALFMPFGLKGAPSTFQRAMNIIFGPEMAEFLLTYLDDLLIFSKTLEEHIEQLNRVLATLRKHGLIANIKKCRFFQRIIEFLGHIISAEGIRMDPAKVEAIVALAAPENLGDLRTFLGAAGFYRRFVEKFAFITAPLSDLTRGGVPFLWLEHHQSAFDKTKHALTTDPVLHPPDMSKPFHVYSDASLVAVGGALMQWTGDGKNSAANLAPVAYASRVLSQTERNWPTHERELFAIVYCFKKFRPYLLGSQLTITSRTDHQSLQYFNTQKDLSAKQARWLEFLAEFDYLFKYVEGKQNQVADMLSRLRREPEPPSQEEQEELLAAVLDFCQLNVVSTVSTDIQGLGAVKQCLAEDDLAKEMIEKLEKGEVAKKQGSTFELMDGYLYRVEGSRRQLYVPEAAKEMRGKLLEEYHDTPFAGHLGRDKTIAAIVEKFWWPSVYSDVEDFVKRCHKCQLMKGRHGMVAGKLMPLKTPEYAWQQMTLDLMGGFPETPEGLDSIVVFIDRFSKMVHLEACRKSDGAKAIAELFHRHVFKLHGLPETIISDRDPRFTGQFWKRLFNLLGSRLNMSTAFHPQTDGQSENTNKTVQQVLRSVVNDRPQDWVSCLSAVEFAINNSKQASTGLSPFEICNGRKAAVPAAYLNPVRTVGPVPAVDEWMKKQQAVIKFVTDNLEKAQQRQKKYADRKRSDIEFCEGQLVKLVSSALRKRKQGPEALVRKFSPRFHGPFRIEKMIGTNAAVLELPGNISNQKHRTFNVEKLAHWYESEKFPLEVDSGNAEAMAELGEQISADTGFFVEAFLEVEKRKPLQRGRPRWEAYVKWRDYSEEENTWEPVSALKADLKKEFLEFYKIWAQRSGTDPLEMLSEAEEDE